MNTQTLQTPFLLLLIAGVLAVSYFMFLPFLNAFILAAVSAVVFQPLYRKILALSGNRQGLSAFIAALLIVIFILAPLLLLGVQIFREAEGLYRSLGEGGAGDAIFGALQKAADTVEHVLPSLLPSGAMSIDVHQYLGQALSVMVRHLGVVFSSIAKIFASSFIFLIMLYYLFKDGEKLVHALIQVSPLSDTDDENIVKKLRLAVRSSVTGTLAIGCIQGTLAGVGFVFFGIPNPILWGAVTAVAALIPGIGTALVLLPAIAFLFLSGHVLPGTGFLVWSVAAVGLIDNFLGPKLMGRGMCLHPFLVFLSVLGGIMFFGPLGFLLGPLVLNLLFALLEIYSRITKSPH